MQQLRIAHKLWLSVLAIVALLVAAIGFAGYRTAKLESESDAASAALATRVALALRWTGLTETNAARTQAVIVSSDPEVERVFKDAMAATTASIGEVQKRIEAMDLPQTDRAQMAQIAEARKTMAAARAKARQLKAAGQLDEAVAFINGTYNPASDAYLQTLRDFVQMQQQAASQQETITANARMATVQMVAAALGAVLLALVVGAAALIRSIQQPLAQANALAAQIASGDLSAHAQVSRGDEFGELLRALYAMSHSLGRMVQQVRQSTDALPPPAAKSPVATTTCRRAPSKPPATCNKLRRRWKSSAAPSAKVPTARSRPARWPPVLQAWRGAAARWSVKWSARWRRSTTAAKKLPTSLA